jgi:tetratricopeptide (TPR) repeat protein
MADVWLWWRNYPEALIRYADLLATRPDDVFRGFIDAASSAPSLSQAQTKQIMEIYDRYAAKMTDTARMVRLAWVMIRTNNPDKADYLLNRVLELQPTAVEVRKELAGALAGRDRIPEAIAVFQSVDNELSYNQRITYAILLTTSGTKEHLAEAERQFRRLIAEGVGPQDVDFRVRFAEMLMWSGKYDKKRYAEALKEFENLARDYPKDIRFPIRIAQCLLWSGKYSEALTRFEDLLTNATITEPRMRRDVWMGFVDSVAGSIGEVSRRASQEDEQPEKYLDLFFTDALRRLVDKAYREIDAVKPETPQRVTDRYISELRYYTESLARIGLGLALMGQKERSRIAFEKAISLNRNIPEIWQQYAQALKLTKDYARAKVIYDALVAGRIPDELP